MQLGHVPMFGANERFLAKTAGENESEYAKYVHRTTQNDLRKFSVTGTIIA